VNYAKLLAWRIAAMGRVAVVKASEGDRATFVMASSSGVDCGAVMKGALSVLGARGGGSPTMAQGAVPVVDAERLVELLRLGLEDERGV